MEFLKKHKETVLSITEKSLFIIIILMTLVIFINEKGLWLDELDWGIGIVESSSSLKDIYITVLATGENLPLFYFVLYFAYKIFGINEDILTYCAAAIPTLIGIIGLAKISKKFFNRKFEIVVLFLSATSYAIMIHSAWQLRPYGLLFCFSSWSLYFYLSRMQEENYANIIKYGICMIFLLYSHWFGSLIALCYAFIDLFLFIKKKIKLRCIISYAIAGLVFLPSFILLLWLHNGDIGSYGVEVTDLNQIYIVIEFISGTCKFESILLLISIIFVFIEMYKKKTNINLNVILISALMLFFVTVIYSAFINPAGAIVRRRYYVTILPHAMIILGYLIYKIIEKFIEMYDNADNLLKAIVYIILIEFIIFFRISNFLYYFITEPNTQGSIYTYQKCAEYLAFQEDIYNDDTLIICSFGKAWVRYYFYDRNIDLPSNVIVVDPLDYPNTEDQSEIDLSFFEYCVSEGKFVDNETVGDIFEYDIIYYFGGYRKLDSELESEILEKYDVEYIEYLNMYKYIRK